MKTKIIQYLILRKKFLLNFILYNKITKNNFELFKRVSFNQRTILSGKGTVQFGKNISLGYKPGGFHRNGTIEIQARYKEAKIVIEDNIATNNNVFICCANSIKIGKDTLIGQNVVIMDFEAHGTLPHHRREIGEIGEVIIGENVWIGNNVSILKNCHIGDNSIIATGSVVTKDIPANVIIGGVPAKIIRNL